MSKVRTPEVMAALKSPSGRLSGYSSAGVHLYGWDSQNEIWHGPTEFGGENAPDKRLLRALRSAASNGSNAWYGPVHCCASGEPMARFFVLVHDLCDSSIALIYCNDSKAGPAEILAVVPANRRSHLRDEFAFEFVAFARFWAQSAPEPSYRCTMRSQQP